MKESLKWRLKDNITLNVLQFIETKDLQKRDKAILNIQSLAKNYNITLRRTRHVLDLQKVLYVFIENNKGYNITLPLLFNSLNNTKI